MALSPTASERRHSFSSISLAKEEAAIGGNSTAPGKPRKRTGLNKKRFWIPALAVYLASVTGASYGFYRLGWNNGWDDAADLMDNWIPVRPKDGYLTGVDGSHWFFSKEGTLEGMSYFDKDEDIAVNRAPTPGKPFSTGYVYVSDTNRPPPTATPSTTLTERKRNWVEARATDLPSVVEEVIEQVVDVVSGSDSDSDGLIVEVVVEGVSTSDSDSEADVVEVVEEDEGSASETELVIEEAEPGLVEVHDPTPDTVIVEDSEPETVLEEIEVTDLSGSGSGSDSELHKRTVVGGTRQRDKYGELPPPVAGGYDPYAIGDEPYGYAGNGDRYIYKGVKAREKVSPQYTQWFEVPAGPDAHLVNPTTGGGLRFYDPLVARPTNRIWDAPIPDAGGYIPKPSFIPDEAITTANIYGEALQPTPAPAAAAHHFQNAHVVPGYLHSTGAPNTYSRSFRTRLSKKPAPTPVSSQLSQSQQIPTLAPSPAAVSASATLVSAVPVPPLVTPVPAVASVSVDVVKGSVAVSVSLPNPATAAGSVSYSVLQGSASASASVATAAPAAPIAPAVGSAAKSASVSSAAAAAATPAVASSAASKAASAAASAAASVLTPAPAVASPSASANANASTNAQKAAPAPASGSAAAPSAAAKDNGPDDDHYVVTLTLPRGVIATPAPVGPLLFNLTTYLVC